MRTLQRFGKPQVLIEKEKEWLDAHLRKVEQEPSTRPSSKQYGHPEIRRALQAMSFNKCFYCERKLSEREQEIDHYIDAADRPDLVFNWQNLYLSCEGCNNGKPSHRDIPVEECVDPCDPKEDPLLHLSFRDDQVSGIPQTKGTRTVQKYRLNRTDLAYQRAKALLEFMKIWVRLTGQSAIEMRRTLTLAQQRVLLQFAEPDMPFSTMFRALLSSIPAVSVPPAGP